MGDSRLDDNEIDAYVANGTLTREQGDLMKQMSGDKQALFAANLVGEAVTDKLGRGWE